MNRQTSDHSILQNLALVLEYLAVSNDLGLLDFKRELLLFQSLHRLEKSVFESGFKVLGQELVVATFHGVQCPLEYLEKVFAQHVGINRIVLHHSEGHEGKVLLVFIGCPVYLVGEW